MPLATATVSGVSIQVGTSLPRPGVVTATLADPYISDDAANAIYSGVDAETVAADGTFSLVLPAGYVYTFRFTPDDDAPGWTIGPALVTVDTGIDDLVTVTAAGVDSVNIGAFDHGNQSGALTLAATIGLQEVTLTGDLAVTPTGPVGTSVMLAAHQDGTGGHTLTVTDATLTVADWTMPTTGFALIVFNHLYSGWLASPAGVTLAAGDTTAPTAGTLAGSAITSDGFTLTVTGAADETALAALPYRFSTDNGTTWSAWRSTAYPATGLTPTTAYTCLHQTKDAAGNISTGTSITVTTGAAASTYSAYTNALAPLVALDLDGNATNTGSNGSTATVTNTTFGGAPLLTEYAASAVFPASGGSQISVPAIGAQSALTIMYVLNAAGWGAYGALALNYAAYADISLGIPNSGGLFPAAQMGGANAKAAAQASLSTTYLLGLRYDGAKLSTWVNGVKVAEVDKTGATPAPDFKLGFNGFYDGRMNGFRLWSTALTDAQMLGAAQAAGLA